MISTLLLALVAIVFTPNNIKLISIFIVILHLLTSVTWCKYLRIIRWPWPHFKSHLSIFFPYWSLTTNLQLTEYHSPHLDPASCFISMGDFGVQVSVCPSVYLFAHPSTFTLGVLWAQLLLQFCTDLFETLHVFSSWYQEVHVVWIYSWDYFLSLFVAPALAWAT